MQNGARWTQGEVNVQNQKSGENFNLVKLCGMVYTGKLYTNDKQAQGSSEVKV